MQLLVEIILLTAAVTAVVCIVLATVYDARRVRSEAGVRREMRRMTKHRQPHVSIIITHTNTSEELQQCLRRMRAGRYNRYDVVAVMSGIGRRERQLLQTKTSIKNFRIYSPRREVADRTLIANAYRRSMHGDMIVILQAQDFIHPTAIKKAVTILHRDPSIEGVKLFGEMNEPGNMTQVNNVFLGLSGRMAIKALQGAGQTFRQQEITTGLYRHQSIAKITKTNHDSLRVVSMHGLDSSLIGHSNYLWRWSEWMPRMLFIAIVAYSSIVAMMLQSAWPLTTTWVIVCLWLLAIIWSDDTTRFKRKIVFSMCVPIGMFVMTASFIVGGFASLFRLKTF